MKPSKVLILIGLIVAFVATYPRAGELTLTVIEKSQDSILKEDGAARYTVRYISTDSQRTNNSSYTLEEPREGNISIQYRGVIDRNVILPEDFAKVGDMICKTNIGDKMYLYAIPLPPSPTVKTNTTGRHERHRKQNQSFPAPANVGE